LAAKGQPQNGRRPKVAILIWECRGFGTGADGLAISQHGIAKRIVNYDPGGGASEVLALVQLFGTAS